MAFVSAQSVYFINSQQGCNFRLQDNVHRQQYLNKPFCLFVCFFPAGQCAQSHKGNEQSHLSHSTLLQFKLLLYGSLVKHYSHAERPPLLPQQMTDVYTAITDLLGETRTNMPPPLFLSACIVTACRHHMDLDLKSTRNYL